MILILWGFVFNWQWIELNIWGVTDVLSAVFRNIIIMVFDKGKKEIERQVFDELLQWQIIFVVHVYHIMCLLSIYCQRYHWLLPFI